MRFFGFVLFVGGGVLAVVTAQGVDPLTLAGVGWPLLGGAVAFGGFVALMRGGGGGSSANYQQDYSRYAAADEPVMFGPNHFADEQMPHTGVYGYKPANSWALDARGRTEQPSRKDAGSIAVPGWPVQEPIPVPPEWTQRVKQ